LDFYIRRERGFHGRMARGGYGLPKVSPGPAMLDPSTPCGQATPERALQPFQGWPARRAGGLRLSSTLLDTARRTAMVGSQLTRLSPNMEMRNTKRASATVPTGTGPRNVVTKCREETNVRAYVKQTMCGCLVTGCSLLPLETGKAYRLR
jgi:hypothetical protein